MDPYTYWSVPKCFPCIQSGATVKILTPRRPSKRCKLGKATRQSSGVQAAPSQVCVVFRKSLQHNVDPAVDSAGQKQHGFAEENHGNFRVLPNHSRPPLMTQMHAKWPSARGDRAFCPSALPGLYTLSHGSRSGHLPSYSQYRLQHMIRKATSKELASAVREIKPVNTHRTCRTLCLKSALARGPNSKNKTRQTCTKIFRFP